MGKRLAQTQQQPASESLHALTGSARDYDALVRRARAADYVLLGEATHGTHEFYRERAAITKRLIAEERFTVVAVEMNARLVVDAERHYRAVYRAGQESWNLRDRHMTQALEQLVAHVRRRERAAKAVVWEHNSHVGDARATDMVELGQLNVGQLMRERHGERAFIAGFTTYTGTVTAASDWGAEAERKHVRPARPGSWEDVFHAQGVPAFVVDAAELDGHGLERAIGVVYRPETELLSHYFHATVGEQFDAVINLDETHAVEPLERTSGWERGELPDTYPWGV